MATVESVLVTNTGLIMKFMVGGLLLADYSTPCPTTSIFASDGTLTPGWASAFGQVGTLDSSGIVTPRSITNDEELAYGTTQVVRSDISRDSLSLKFVAEETNNTTIALERGVTVASMPAIGAALSMDRPVAATQPLRRALILAHDTQNDVIMGRLLPRVKVTAIDDLSQMMTATYKRGYTLDAYHDSIVGTSERFFLGGPGWLALANGGNATAITVTPTTSSISAAAHATSQLSVAATYPNGTTGVNVTSSATFSSSNAGVATVSSTGLITAVSVGTAVVTASYQGQQAQNTTTVTT
jgi:hypothetical protein